MKRGSKMEVETQHQQQQHKRMKTTQTTTSLKDLPEEIMNEIFLRIPVDELVEIKNVSKLWCRLISDRKFVRAHLNRNRHQWEYQQIIFCKSEQQYPVFNLQEEEDVKVVPKLNFATLFNNRKVQFEYCFDGLFLFKSYGGFTKWYICNPVTGKCTTHPIPKTEELSISNWILTYDDSAQKYKIVGFLNDLSTCIVYTPHNEEEEEEEGGSGSGHWTKMVTGYENFDFISTPTLIDKELHWLVTPHFADNVILCSMDVSKEEFRATQVPFLTTISWGKNTILDIMGSFCLIDYCREQNVLDIWTSQDKGRQGNWTKIHSIVTCNFEFNRGVRPSFSSTQTKILVSGNNQVFVYDFKYKDWKRIDIPVEKDMVGEFIHINSLVDWN